MVRNILAVVAGLAAGFAVISGLQYLNAMVFPPPPGVDPANPEHLARLVRELPLLALLGLEVSYFLGSLAAGAAAGFVARSHGVRIALGIGALLTVGNLVNLTTIPHPVWIAVLTTVTFLPVSWLGARLTVREP